MGNVHTHKWNRWIALSCPWNASGRSGDSALKLGNILLSTVFVFIACKAELTILLSKLT